mgnify:FL=1
MKLNILAVAVTATVTASPCLADSGTSVDNAYRLCAVFDGTGLTSSKCSVSGWNSSVDVKIDMTSGEARKLCVQVAALARQKGMTFDPGWQIRIYSPYSGDNTIAFCQL